MHRAPLSSKKASAVCRTVAKEGFTVEKEVSTSRQRRIGRRAGGVGSPDYKAVRPCVSAAHIYGKRRVAAEALTMTRCDWSIEYLRAF